ncbi:hypothetical protein [Shimazuella kribbensis]|uniref:hypothetical protein n=1 Tax=Shimazuella kribbensis TaxID=139808 RepID=UPI0003F8234F|nr:hypothetical protein [Shimazuella kribbensis]
MSSRKVGFTKLVQSLPRKFLTAFLCLIVVVGLYSVPMLLPNVDNGRLFVDFDDDRKFFFIFFAFWASIVIFTYGVITSLLIDFLIDNLSLRFARLYKLVLYIILGMLGNLVIGEANFANPICIVISLIFFGIDELLQAKKKVI